MVPPLLALFAFPVLVIVLFARLRPVTALISSILAGYLFLPQGRGIDLPMLPSFDKDFIPAVAVLLCAAVVLAQSKTADPRVLPGWLPRSNVVRICLGLVVLSIFGMVVTNGDTLVYGPLILPALRLYDAASLIVGVVTMLLPFLLARRFLGHPDMHLQLLWLLVIAGLGYSFLALYEARMSPQLNTRIYGYFQHRWNQHIRGDGYRPIVFLQHGLWVSLFFSTVTLSALALFRATGAQTRIRYLFAAGWLLMTLVITKSLGALAVTLLLAPVILFLNVRMQLLAASLLAAMVITYPALRGVGLAPIDRVTAIAESVDPARALSFETRLRNEDLLLAKAQERPFFGWGTWGRNRVFDNRGETVTTPDGYWIIIIGMRGWVGYVGIFGLLSAGIIGLAIHRKRIDITPATAGLAVVLAGNIVDLIPNATLTPVTWLMAGALLGRLEHGRITETSKVAGQNPEGHPSSRYTRFGQGQTVGVRSRTQVREAAFSRFPSQTDS